MHRIARTLVAAALAAATFTPAAAPAQSRPLSQHVLSRGFSERPHAKPAALAANRTNRVVYGKIDAIKANIIAVRTRNGRELRVDATDVLKSGMYSAPLFVGKLVSISGYYDTARTLHAATITRDTPSDASSAIDR